MNKDLTQGNIRKTLWLYCLPLMGSIVLHQIYNLADSVIAGRFLGEAALAAVGNASEITLFYTAFAMGCNMGCQVIISQLFGAKNYKSLKTGVTTSFIAFGVLCLLLMTFGMIFTKPILQLMHTPEDILQDSIDYLEIYTLGVPFVFFYNICNGVFGALGDSKTPFIFLAASSVANILVDILFVGVFHMGVKGVAWATFLCQGISAVLSMVVLGFRLHKMKCEKFKVFSPLLLKKLTVVALPSIMQQSFISVGNILVQSVVNGYGSSVIAGFTAAMKWNNIAVACFFAIASGLSAYFAQNIGARTYDRLKDGYKEAIYFAWLIAIPFIGLFCGLGKFGIEFFLDNTASTLAIDTGVKILRSISPFYLIVSVKVVTDGVLRGAGAMKLFMIDTFADLALRVGFSFLFSYLFGSDGIWFSWGAGWTIGCIIGLFFYFKGYWKKNFEFLQNVDS